jgi:alkanesulfonate monooxygenase SsuD/methylene tetrahydromethanopterin reductase-like flavin-dependent oxidoreductase (luciferase family)
MHVYAAQLTSWPALRDEVSYLESLNIGTVWLADGFAFPPYPVLLEAWTAMAALAALTARVRLGTLISNVALRHPAMLAKQAATVDTLSGGRLDLGLGSGDQQRENAAWLGLPAPRSGGPVDRFREAVEVIDRLLRDRHLSYQGAHYQLDEAPLTPAPVQQPRPPLCIAADGTRALRIVAERADVWVTVPWGETSERALQKVRERKALLDEYCQAINRDPATIECACLAGWGTPDAPFASATAFDEFVGRYREAGVQRFVFFVGSTRMPDPFGGWVAAGKWAGRDALEAFAAQAMADLRL